LAEVNLNVSAGVSLGPSFAAPAETPFREAESDGPARLEAARTLALSYDLEPISLRRLKSGSVNLTYLAETSAGEFRVLQRLSGDFGKSAAPGLNWSRVEAVMEGRSTVVPKIFATTRGEWLAGDSAGFSWRLTEFFPGRPPNPKSTEEAFAAGLTLGRCHKALNQPKPLELEPLPADREFANNHLCLQSDFELISERYRGHPNLPKIVSEIARGSVAAGFLPTRPSFRRVFLAQDLVVHLDPKRENFLTDGERWALIDWDTVGYGDTLLDLGEACRSWAYDRDERRFRAETAAAVVSGYRESGADLDRERSRLLPTVVRAVAANLARRYLIDSLAEVHFRWDPSRHSSLFEQNRHRAALWLDLAEELLDREMELMKI
jgi:Ser/Thr protein kinase RdoA (MazF antagonist)